MTQWCVVNELQVHCRSVGQVHFLVGPKKKRLCDNLRSCQCVMRWKKLTINWVDLAKWSNVVGTKRQQLSRVSGGLSRFYMETRATEPVL